MKIIAATSFAKIKPILFIYLDIEIVNASDLVGDHKTGVPVPFQCLSAGGYAGVTEINNAEVSEFVQLSTTKESLISSSLRLLKPLITAKSETSLRRAEPPGPLGVRLRSILTS